MSKSELDVHELLKREAFGDPSASGDAHFEKSRPDPDGVHGFSDQYLVLDSWEKDRGRSAPAQGVFAWNFATQMQTSDQAIGSRDVIDNVTEIQLGAFTIPYIFPNVQMTNPWAGRLISGLPGLTAGPDFSAATDPIGATFGWLSPYVGRVTVELKEIGLQSISQRKGIRYHFEADVVAVYLAQGSLNTALGTPIANPFHPFPDALRVTPLQSLDTYRFTEPIQDVHGLTLQIRAVDGPVPFPEDVVVGATAYTAPSIWPSLGFALTVPEDWVQTTAYVFVSSGAAQMVISGFTSADPSVNAWVNQEAGLVERVVSLGLAPAIAVSAEDIPNEVVNLTACVVPGPLINISTLVPVAPTEMVTIPSATTITVRFTSARVRIPLRLRRVVPRLTNYA